jgi:hypothetical protein
MMRFTRPVWSCTLPTPYDQTGVRGEIIITVIVIAVLGDDGVATCIPHIKAVIDPHQGGILQNRAFFDRVVAKHVGVKSATSLWNEFADWRRDPWDVLGQIMEDRRRFGNGESTISYYASTTEELVEDVKRTIVRVAHASMHYLSTHDHEAFQVMMSRFLPHGLSCDVSDGTRTRSVNVHDLLATGGKGAHRWTETVIRDLVNVKEVRCSWEP